MWMISTKSARLKLSETIPPEATGRRSSVRSGRLGDRQVAPVRFLGVLESPEAERRHRPWSWLGLREELLALRPEPAEPFAH